jgi:hypothetical protein
MDFPGENAVIVVESGNGAYAQFVTAGRHIMGADEPVDFACLGWTEQDRPIRIISLTGDLTSEQSDRLLKVAEKCPVSQTLQRASEVISRPAETTAPALA